MNAPAALTERTHPVFGPNRLKLGIFAMNCSHGCAITTAAGAHEVSWAGNLALAQGADDAGFELLVPIGRWRGFGGESNFNATNFETYTWAAGIAQGTQNTGVMTTSHISVVHPIVAAKQGATIDHISGGRYGLNIVCGWSPSEMGMFGSSLMEHGARYDYADEWVSIVRRLWSSEEEFSYEGKYLRVDNAFSLPKPMQSMPPLMNAGGSPRGRQFCAQNCDVAFLLLDPGNMAGTKAKIDNYRDYARQEFGRELKIWAYGYVVQGETVAEAEEKLRYYAVEKGDDVAVENLVRELGIDKVLGPGEAYETFKYHFKAGYGGYPLVGTTETITETLAQLSDAGLDGIALAWFDYGAGLGQWNRTVLPAMKSAGLRL